jgi:hypothetical protein
MAALQREGPVIGRVTALAVIRRTETYRNGTPFPAAGSFLFPLAFLVVSALAGCATAPTEADTERLDTKTGTTLTVMPKPVELIVDKARGTKTDPFAYIAPFETNRMGSHELYLWISAPQVAGPLGVPKVYCGETPIALEGYEGSMADVGLSSPPYKMPAPWSRQWFFKLPGEVLDCFASATRIRVVTQAGDAEPESFVAEGAAISGLSAFVARLRT